MRRKDRELIDFERMTEILKACDVAMISMTGSDDLPYCVPVNFGFTVEEKTLTLFFHGAKEGKKAELLRKNPPVAVCMYRSLGVIAGKVACDYGVAYESVMAFGRACLLDDEKQRRKGLSAIMEKVGGEHLPFEEAVLTRTAVFAIRVEQWSAKQRLPKTGSSGASYTFPAVVRQEF